MFKHVLISDEAVWEATLTRWKTDALAVGEEGVFIASDVEQRLNWIRQLTLEEKNLHGYFLVKDGNSFASALLEISHAMPGTDAAWLKLLNITLQPSLSFALEQRTLGGFNEAFPVLTQSIIHVLKLTFDEHPSKVLKIYGRTEEVRGLFAAIASSGVLSSGLEMFGLSVKFEGNWLVLTKIS